MKKSIQKTIHKLQKNDAIYRIIADYTYDWENQFDNSGKLLQVNRAVERMTGYSKEEYLQMTNYPLPLVIQEDKSMVNDILNTGCYCKT